MIRAAIIFVTLFVLAAFLVVLLLSAITMLAIMALIAIPLWKLAKPHLQKAGVVGDGRPPLKRLQAMYAEGKIDMFEFERRVAKVLSRDS